jgi:beta-glucanase (GH16 family)
MPPNSVGTLLASTHYVWYGKITAKLKTSRGAGVVTAFILLSDVKDEIDFEFVGVELDTAQTNFYFQGITNCKRQTLNPSRAAS